MFKLFQNKKDRLSIKKNREVKVFEGGDDIPYILYDIYYGKLKVGGLELSPIMNEYMYYYGHIGYHIDFLYRGHHFARSATILLMQEALKEYNLKEFIITCNPDNIASKKTIEKLPNVAFIERVKIPSTHLLYIQGEREKLVYKVSL